MHGLEEATCSICKGPSSTTVTQTTLVFGAIRAAVDDLASVGDFRTKQVAEHPAVVDAHPQFQSDPRFAQQIGTYLTSSLGVLKIVQVSPKSVSNATWRRTATPSADR